jgi:hypothetical protein
MVIRTTTSTLPPTTVELPVFALLIGLCARVCRASRWPDTFTTPACGNGSIGRVNARNPNGQQLIITDQTPEVVALELPAEPPIGSVIIDRDGMAWQSRTAWQARVLRGDGRVTWVSTGPRHLFAFGMRPEDGLTDWTLLVAERSPLTIVHVAEPTDVAVEDWDWGIHDAETYVPRGT